jgi:TonB-linked SusC/RagA family outer membrane protein
MKKILMLFSLLLITGSLVFSQTVQITGTVTSSQDGLAMPGVNVTVKGTTIGAITGADGKFAISAPQNSQALLFSFIGFRTKEVAIAGKTRIDATLDQDLFNVDEVVVVAYGVKQKRDVVGSVSTIKGDAIKSVPVQSFDQALQGKAAGVSITLPNGVLNNPAVIRIRGFNSISSSSYPLIVVDGVPIFTGDISNNSAASNPLSDISPSDIASMEVLKDASATAIYGSRAANGVILITTKTGSAGKTKVTIDSYIGFTQPYNLFKTYNAREYIRAKNAARANLRALGGSATGDFFLNLDAKGDTIDTNWSDYIYRTGFQQNQAISFSGASGPTTYFLSLGYTTQEGMIQQNSFERKNVRLNLEHKLMKWVTLGANISYVNTFNAAPNTGSLAGQGFNTAGAGRLAFVTTPIVSPYNYDGTYNFDGPGNKMGTNGEPDNTGYYNPKLIFDLNKFTTESDRILGTLSATITPFKGFVLKTVYGMDNISSESITFQTPIHGDGYSGGLASNTFDRRLRWTWTNTANYMRTFFDKLNSGFLIGVEEQYTNVNGWSGSRTTISDPFFTTYQGSWVTPNNPPSLSQFENYFISTFGRVNFDWDKKYYIELSMRRDGFSGLATGHKYGTFGGASLMWNLSNEDFIKNGPLGDIFTDLRVKASYGRVGNISGIASYGSYFLYSSGVYGAQPTWALTQVGNPDLGWEASNKIDAGLSFGVLKDKLQFEINYYRNTINDLILDLPQPPSKGIPGNTVPVNIGSMYNTGVEFSLTSYNINTKKFQWNTTINFSTLKNEVTALAPTVPYITGTTSGLENTNRTMVGYPIGEIFGVQTMGVDPAEGRRIFMKADGSLVTYQHRAATGHFNWENLGSGTSAVAANVAADGKPLGSPIPKFYGGIDNNFTWGNFDFSLGLTYALDFVVYNGSKAGLRDQRYWNNAENVYPDSWKKPGDITNIPRVIYGDNVSNGSTMVISENVERGDYMKVRSVNLGYTFKNVLPNIGLQSIRVYTQVFNAFVFTKYTGSDPEVSANGNANLTPGVDRNTAPQARSYTFGVNISF